MEKIKKIIGWFIIIQAIPVICGIDTSFGACQTRYFKYAGEPSFWAGYFIGIEIVLLVALVTTILWLIIKYLL